MFSCFADRNHADKPEDNFIYMYLLSPMPAVDKIDLIAIANSEYWYWAFCFEYSFLFIFLIVGFTRTNIYILLGDPDLGGLHEGKIDPTCTVNHKLYFFTNFVNL